MLANLLEFSRLEKNSKKLNISRFNLIEVVEESIEMFRPFAETKNLHLEFDNRIENPFIAETDSTILKQILSNLLSNAVKYTVKGSVKLSLQQTESNHIIFTVSDTGIGIDEKDMPEIFKPFSRIQNPLKEEGSGFGMYVTKGLTEALNGTIQIQSKKIKEHALRLNYPSNKLKKQTKQSSRRRISLPKTIILFRSVS